MVYVVAIQKQGKSFKVTVPKIWCDENLEPSSRIMYMVAEDVGVLRLYSERVWYEKYFSKGSDGADKGAAESGEGSDGQGLVVRAGGESEDPGIAPADHITKRA